MKDTNTTTSPCSPNRVVQFRGEDLTITPFRLEQLGPFITASRTIIARVALLAGVLRGSRKLEAGAIVLGLLEQDGAEIAAAIAVAVEREPEWIAAASLDDVAQLVEAVVGVNKHFFASRLRAMLDAVCEVEPSETAAPMN